MPTTTKREKPWKLAMRWKDNPTKIYYFFFNTHSRLKKLANGKWKDRYEWGAIYERRELIEEFKLDTGWQRK